MFLLWTAAFAADPSALESYTRDHLYRSTYAVVEGGVQITTTYDPKSAPTPWAVFDGTGHLLGAEDFANDVGDQGVIDRIRKESTKDRNASIVTTVAAVVIASAGLSTGASGAPDYSSGMSPPQAQPPTLLWDYIKHNRPVSRYYSAEVADELIVAHNAGLRRALGLTVDDTAAIDTPK